MGAKGSDQVPRLFSVLCLSLDDSPGANFQKSIDCILFRRLSFIGWSSHKKKLISGNLRRHLDGGTVAVAIANKSCGSCLAYLRCSSEDMILLSV